jgi:putative addiction module component (TIGR02574 family)
MQQVSIAAITALSIPERIQLVEDIWDSIAAYPEEVALTDDQKAELDIRLAEYEENPDAGVSWSEVRSRLWKLL